jgi:hypothetical protein
VALLAVAAFTAPAMVFQDDDVERRYGTFFVHMGEAPAEIEPRFAPAAAHDMPGTGALEGGAPRQLGVVDWTRRAARYGVRGPADNPDPHIARATSYQDLAIVHGPDAEYIGGTPDEPTARWGRDESLGTDERSGKGKVWGETIGHARGAAGLTGDGGVRLADT